MALLALQGSLALFGLNAMAGGGHDRMISNALWLLVLADSGRTLSVACRWRTGSWLDSTPVPAWPRQMFILQLVVIYTATGLQKLAPEWFFWGDLRAVHNMLLSPAWARYDLAPYLGWLSPLTQGATLLTWLWESTFFLIYWRRHDLRRIYVPLGVCFHLGLWILADLGPFSAISLALYPCFFRPEEIWRAWRGFIPPDVSGDRLPPPLSAPVPTSRSS